MSTTEDRDRTEWLKAFGEAVKECRLGKGMSQEELGFRSGLDRTFISHVERGTRNATLWAVRRLASGLETPASVILEMAEKKLSASPE